MPNWAGSCWYELRYLDPDNAERLVDPEVERYWMGPRPAAAPAASSCTSAASSTPCCTCCTRGSGTRCSSTWATSPRASRSTGWSTRACCSCRPTPTSAASTSRPRRSTSRDGVLLYEGEAVKREFGKIGKSLKNVVTPDEIIDALRRRHVPAVRDVHRPAGPVPAVGRQGDVGHVPAAAAGLAHRHRRGDRRMPGERRPDRRRATRRCCTRRSPRCATGCRHCGSTPRSRGSPSCQPPDPEYPDGGVPREVAEPMVLMLAPLAPHIAEELWSRLGHAESLAWQASRRPIRRCWSTTRWRSRCRSTERSAHGAGRRATPTGRRWRRRPAPTSGSPHHLQGATERKVIVVPGRLVNFVVG